MIRVGIVGLGYWGSKYLTLHNDRDAEITACCDVSPELLRKIPDRIYTTSDYREILEHVDAVVIATPPAYHFEIAEAAMNAGKDILVEKPMTMTIEQADALLRLSDDTNRILMVDHTFLYNRAVEKIRRIIQEGKLGRIDYIFSKRSNLGPKLLPEGVIWDIAPHEISIITYLLGEWPNRITIASKTTRLDGKTPDSVMINMEIRGVQATSLLSWRDVFKKRELSIAGSQGVLVCEDLHSKDQARIYLQGYKLEDGEFHPDERLIYEVDVSDTLDRVWREFITCIKTRRKPLTDAVQGFAVVNLIESATNPVKTHASKP